VLGQLDVEHILEWQTVTGFFEWLDKKYPGFCKMLLDGNWAPKDPNQNSQIVLWWSGTDS
jgi:hypothetical protein